LLRGGEGFFLVKESLNDAILEFDSYLTSGGFLDEIFKEVRISYALQLAFASGRITKDVGLG